MEKLRRSESKCIPAGVDYNAIPSLRAETRQKLTKIRPETLGQAARISGITPADVAVLSIFLRKGRRSISETPEIDIGSADEEAI